MFLPKMNPAKPTEVYAHTPSTDGGAWHGLVTHLVSVAEKASAAGAKFGAADICAQLGLAHDLGKADPRFQAYLRTCAEGRPSGACPHSAPSAAAVFRHLRLLVLPILGHHAGMPDKADVKRLLQNADPQSTKCAEEFASTIYPNVKVEPLAWANNDLSAEMLIRMCFSCLVDADYLDTAAHFSRIEEVLRGGYPEIAKYCEKLERHLAKFEGETGRVNQVRAEILADCREASPKPKGAFRLTVPTGGGKTLSGLSFALNHAVHHKMDRVIVSIPYTSIIDQTAAVYGEVLGKENVLEHHSSVDLDEDENGQTDRDLRRRLTIQNWDCPLVVTTTVQLFESLLHNKPSRCRKLHNIANSVLLLDEVQALPPKHLGAILDVLNELVEHYGCTVVFCTATQLDYSTVDDRLLATSTEIVPDYLRHFEDLKRVAYQVEQETWSVERIVEALQHERQALAVFNTRKDALAIAKRCDPAHLLHLSTLMCPDHRKRVLKNVRDLLNENQPIRLISTQVVEAGVDLDFPVVFRDLGPLDRIIQVAGRCNREGKLTGLGRCVVFQLEDGSSPKGPYQTAIEITRTLLNEPGAELDSPEVLKSYSRDLFPCTETGSLNSPNDRAEIQKLRRELAYQTVANTFKMIEQATTPLIVESYPFADLSSLIAEWGFRPGGWFRRISQYAVNVYANDLSRLSQQGHVRQHESGAWLYSGPYDKVFGISPDFSDPADLIA